MTCLGRLFENPAIDQIYFHLQTLSLCFQMLRIRSTTTLYWTFLNSNLLALSVCSESSLFILKTGDFSISDEDLQCGSSSGQEMLLNKSVWLKVFPKLSKNIENLQPDRAPG